MAGFSGAIKLADMNDYLAPNQACIIPVTKSKGKGAEAATADSTASSAPAATRGRVEMELSSSDANDLRFPGLFATGGAAGAISSLTGAAPAGGHFDQIKTDPLKKTASVTLADCLACSGCVTSAETVLITQQSTQEFINVLQANEQAAAAASSSAAAVAASDASVPPATPTARTVVVSISPQSLTALAHDFGVSPLVCARKLNTFFVRRLGCHMFLDTTPALDVALLEAREEFIARYKESQRKFSATAAGAGGAVKTVAASAASPADSSDSSTVIPTSASPLPILTSECPGFVCYTEKTQGLDVLRHLSSVKSPQALLASWLKQHWAPSQTPPVAPSSLYHVTVMPCYDKKLEASRPDFFLESWETRETDVVLTTGEVRELLRDRGVDLAKPVSAEGSDGEGIEESDLNPAHWNVSADQSALYRSADMGASGGYTENLFRYAARRLFGVVLPVDAPLPYKAQRNADYRELSLEVGGQTVLSFALAYGFRNIQNLVRKMKMKKPAAIMPSADTSMAVGSAAAAEEGAAGSSDGAVAQQAGGALRLPAGSGGYHYCEVMACPSGCLNGGGQLRPPGSTESASGSGMVDIRAQKQLVTDLDRLFHEERQQVCQPEDNPIVRRWYSEWLQGSLPYKGRARQMLHTQYHAVEKELANPLGIKW